MKKFKKIGAFVLVVVMMLALSVTAFAAGDGSDSLGTGDTVTIEDRLIAFNPDESSIYAPAVTFNYSIAAGTGGVTITDSDDVQAVVLAGDWSGTDSNGNSISVSGAPTITASNSYSMDDTLNASATGDDTNVKNIEISFESVTFPKPGVYRYTVTREIDDTNLALESADTIVRTLDVYVMEENGTRSIYGYILHDVDGDVDESSTTKYDHYESEYKTSNLTVGKTLVNDSMMNGHKFPFSVTFTGTKNAHIMVDPNEGVSGKATAADMAAGVTSSEPGIANEGIVKYLGIPNGFTATVYETNDVTGTSYKSEGVADTAAAAKVINWTGDTANSNSASSAAATDVTKTIAFTNTLELISPTGVVMRVAPYVMILTAGIALLNVSKRGRREEA